MIFYLHLQLQLHSITMSGKTHANTLKFNFLYSVWCWIANKKHDGKLRERP